MLGFALTVVLAYDVAYGLGDGHTGALTANDAGVVVNRYAPFTGSVDAGATEVVINGTNPFVVGDLVLLHQVATPIAARPGDGGVFDVEDAGVGQFQLTRVVGIVGRTVSLADPVRHDFPQRSQVVSVPELTDVTVPKGTSLVAQPWDGTSGGVVALLATGTVTVEGSISASGAGFRGGPYVDDTVGGQGCVDIAEPPANGARRGEGASTGHYSAMGTGWGNIANGGGGGVCINAGGGGGGAASPGGQGGFTSGFDMRRNVGGRGGAALGFTTADRLVFGGGGGAGHGNDNLGTAGANGGGAVFVRAHTLSGNGSIVSRGDDAASSGLASNGAGDGAGGAGAGGTVYLAAIDDWTQGLVDVMGGTGGNTLELSSMAGPVGPGGGGSGGWLRVIMPVFGGVVHIGSGAGGTQPDTGFAVNYGAAPSTVNDPSAAGRLAFANEPFGGVPDAGPITVADAGPVQARTLRVGCGCTSGAELPLLALTLCRVLSRSRCARPSRASRPSR